MMSQEFKKLIEQLQDDPKIISKFLADPVAFLENYILLLKSVKHFYHVMLKR